MAPSLLRDKAVSKYYGHYELDGNINLGSAIPTAHCVCTLLEDRDSGEGGVKF